MTILKNLLATLNRKLFKGNAALVVPGSSTTEILESVNSNFTVNAVSPEFGGRTYNDYKLWLRSDNGDSLGQFGNRRQPQDPQVIGDFFQSFCDNSEKRISLDVVGSINKGKTLYMASRLAGDTTELNDPTDLRGMAIKREGSEYYIAPADRTEHWLMLLVHYGESLSTKAVVFSNELVCTNGMALKTVDKSMVIPHRSLADGFQVEQILNQGVRSSQAYMLMKDRFQNEALPIADGCNLIREFHDDPEGESQVVKNLERIYRYGLIGGDLPERTDNFWRLANAHTQYTSHSYVSKADPGKTLLSQLEGSKARSNRDWMQFLESQFSPGADRTLVLA